MHRGERDTAGAAQKAALEAVDPHRLLEGHTSRKFQRRLNYGLRRRDQLGSRP
jgi:hypothetical protein